MRATKRRRIDVVQVLARQLEQCQDEIERLRSENEQLKSLNLDPLFVDTGPIDAGDMFAQTPTYERTEAAIKIQGFFRKYFPKECEHEWEIERGCGHDHTYRYCFKCDEQDGFA